MHSNVVDRVGKNEGGKDKGAKYGTVGIGDGDGRRSVVLAVCGVTTVTAPLSTLQRCRRYSTINATGPLMLQHRRIYSNIDATTPLTLQQY